MNGLHYQPTAAIGLSDHEIKDIFIHASGVGCRMMRTELIAEIFKASVLFIIDSIDWLIGK